MVKQVTNVINVVITQCLVFKQEQFTLWTAKCYTHNCTFIPGIYLSNDVFNFILLHSKAQTMTWLKQNKGMWCFTGCTDYSLFSGRHQKSSPDHRDRNSARRRFITIWWLKLVYSSTVQRRSCIVCSGSSNQHPGDSLPWVTPVSDTLSAAYMPPTPPLLHPSLCALSLCSHYVLSCLLFSLRIVSLLLCFPHWLSCPRSLFLSTSAPPSLLVPFYSNWLSLKLSSSHVLLSPPCSLS